MRGQAQRDRAVFPGPDEIKRGSRHLALVGPQADRAAGDLTLQRFLCLTKNCC